MSPPAASSTAPASPSEPTDTSSAQSTEASPSGTAEVSLWHACWQSPTKEPGIAYCVDSGLTRLNKFRATFDPDKSGATVLGETPPYFVKLADGSTCGLDLNQKRGTDDWYPILFCLEGCQKAEVLVIPFDSGLSFVRDGKQFSMYRAKNEADPASVLQPVAEYWKAK